jgi:lysophospholipase L1-like esterase
MTPPPPQRQRRRPCILLLGDSLTELGFGGIEGEECADPFAVGWVSLLAAAYSRRADVLNRGYRGYNTEMILSILPDILSDLQYHRQNDCILLTVVFLGPNDAVLPTDSRHVPKDRFADNLRRIISELRQNLSNRGCFRPDSDSNDPPPPILLLTPPPVDRKAREEFCLRAYGDLSRAQRCNDATRSIGNVIQTVAQELQCPILDVFDRLGGNADALYHHSLVDGLHLSGPANIQVYQGLMDLITKRFPHLAPMKDGQGRYGKIGIPLDQKLCHEY